MPRDGLPLFGDRHRHLDTSVVKITSLALAVVAVVVLLLFLILPPSPGVAPEARLARTGAAAAMLVISLATFFLARRGRVRQAAVLWGAGLFLVLMVMPIVLELGVHSVGLPLLAALIMFTGFLVRPAAALATTALGVAAIVGLYWAETAGFLAGRTPATAPAPLVLAGGYIILFVTVGWLTIRYAGLFGSTIRLLEDSRRDLRAMLASQREDQERLRLALGVAHQGWFELNVETGEVLVSPEYPRLLGYAPEEFQSSLSQWFDNVHPDDRLSVMTAFQNALVTDEPAKIAYRRRGKSAEWVWIESVGRVTERDADGKPLKVTGIHMDITPHKQAEAALLEAKEAAVAASLAKSQFLATMSHEIRTPLNGILGMAQLLLTDDGLTDAERRDYTRTILNSGQALLTLLNDILDLSKVEAGKLELLHEVFSPQQVVEETAALFRQLAHAKGLTIESQWLGPPGQRYRADPVRLRQMLANLIGNAIKFTSQGFIRIEARQIEASGAHALVEFSVADSGIGIPADKQPLLFHPFTQADSSTTREYGGTGLGLSIVRRLAELMDGTVGLTSEVGQGSRFWFRIHAGIVHADDESRSARRLAAPASARDAGQGMTGLVLVVEDNPINRKVIEALLAKLGLRTHCTDNGQAALDALRQGLRPQVVLMDLQMPVMDGLAAAGHIRQWERDNGTAPLPIVALTAGASAEDQRQCLAAGMDGFLTKPIEIGALAATLARWLEEGRPAGH